MLQDEQNRFRVPKYIVLFVASLIRYSQTVDGGGRIVVIV